MLILILILRVSLQKLITEGALSVAKLWCEFRWLPCAYSILFCAAGSTNLSWLIALSCMHMYRSDGWTPRKDVATRSPHIGVLRHPIDEYLIPSMHSTGALLVHKLVQRSEQGLYVG